MQPEDVSAPDRPSVVERGLEVVPDDDVVQIPAQAGAPDVLVVHATRLDEQGAFVVATCTCGWRSYARRSRPLARAEARDHELLQAAGA